MSRNRSNVSTTQRKHKTNDENVQKWTIACAFLLQQRKNLQSLDWFPVYITWKVQTICKTTDYVSYYKVQFFRHILIYAISEKYHSRASRVFHLSFPKNQDFWQKRNFELRNFSPPNLVKTNFKRLNGMIDFL